MNTMFSTLLQLPLFQGLSQEDFTNILGRVRLHFSKHKEGEIIIHEKEPCTKLVFLLQGEITATTISEDKTFSLAEKFQGPYLVEPYSLFGMNTNYRSTYTASSNIGMVSIDKIFILKELFKYEIFRLNFANMICSKIQSFYKKTWNLAPESVEDKIVRFVLTLIEKPEGEKSIKIRMEDLARHVDDTRLNVSKALNDLQEKGLVELNRKEIFIPNGLSLLERKKPEPEHT
ncbi:Crp/Fnr family transcriptional regulator [Bacteroides sp. 519]|uniref:Crp/Fnr family transcriptional regulator n=1 Tax=Bacteroides sp. 519 TaxID=2302937 RepID=UPI0013D3B8D6|nr:Crp/Fnr family transcriptional regulator [Bacteroides sp. 519]NDV60138.1 Crp/Fnr family transcriptional regulator [Bacteroides sp. 519]